MNSPAKNLREDTSRLFRLEVCQNIWRLGNLVPYIALLQSARHECDSGKDIAELAAIDSPGVAAGDVV